MTPLPKTRALLQSVRKGLFNLARSTGRTNTISDTSVITSIALLEDQHAEIGRELAEARETAAIELRSKMRTVA